MTIDTERESRGIKVRIARRGVESSSHLGPDRWVVERSISWLLQFQRLGLRRTSPQSRPKHRSAPPPPSNRYSAGVGFCLSHQGLTRPQASTSSGQVYFHMVGSLVHLNGPPGIGKSTLAALHADRHPGTLNLDVDLVHQLIGGWRDEDNRTWRVVWPLVRAMAATQLDAGRDVVLPQYLARPDEIVALEDLAREHGTDFREVVLLDDREAAIARFARRARDVDDPYVRYMHRHVEERGGPRRLAAMYDDLVELVRQRPATVVVPSVAGAVEQTYALLADALLAETLLIDPPDGP